MTSTIPPAVSLLNAAPTANTASPVVSGTTSSLAAVPAQPTARSYASATKTFSPPPTASSTQPPAVAVGGSAPVQYGKSNSISPVNGRNSISPAVPVNGGQPAIVNSSSTTNGAPGQGDHGRKASVVISAQGASGPMPNGGAAGQVKPNITFGSMNAPGSPAIANSVFYHSPNSSLSAPAHNPRITSPSHSPVPIPQPTASGGRPPSSLQAPSNMLSFGSMGGENGDHNLRPGPMSTPSQQSAHLRRESSQSTHSDISNTGMSNMNRGFVPNGGRGGRGGYAQVYPPHITQSPGQNFRQAPGQQRGAANMSPHFQPQGPMGHPSAQFRVPPRSPGPAATPQMHMPQGHMANNPQMQYGGYQQHLNPQQQQQNMQGMYAMPPHYDPSQGYYHPYPQFYMPPPSSPRAGYQQPHYGMQQQQHMPPPFQPQSMSRSGSQISERPESRLGAPAQTPAMSAASQTTQRTSTPSISSPAPPAASNFTIPPKAKSKAIIIKNEKGEELNFDKKSVSPAPNPSRSPDIVSTPKPTSRPTPPPPRKPSNAESQPPRTETKSVQSDAEVKQSFQEQVKRQLEADRAEEKRKKDEHDQKVVQDMADADARVAKEKEEADAKTMQEKAEAEAKAAKEKEEAETKAAKEKEEAETKAAKEKEEAETKAAKEKEEAEAQAAKEKEESDAKAAKDKEEADAKARAEEEATKKAVAEAERAAAADAKDKDDAEKLKADDDDKARLQQEEDERLEREIAEMEELERQEEEREKAYQEKKKKEREEKARKDAEAAANADEEMGRAELEAEAAEDANKASKPTDEASAAFASLKKPTFGPGAVASESGTATPASDESASMPPPQQPAQPKFTASKPKPAHLKLETSKPVEPAQPTPAMQALKSARFLRVQSDSAIYPEGIKSPNPAANPGGARAGKQYDNAFLLQFQNVFKEPPSIDWEAKIKETLGESSDSTPRTSTRTPSSMAMGARQPSGRQAAAPSFSAMGSFASGGRTLPPGTTSQDRFLASQAGSAPRPTMNNPLASFAGRPGGFPVGGPAPMSRTSSLQTMGQMGGPKSPRTGTSARGKRDSRRGGLDKAPSRREEEQAAKVMPLTAGMDLKPLELSKSGWKPTSVINPVASNLDPSGHMAPDMVQRKVKAALNKMTPEKFDKISDQILEIAGQSKNENDGRTLRQVIALTFEKACDEAHWASMYAKFCHRMLQTMSPDIKDENVRDKNGNPVVGGGLFRKYLLNRCQEEFERGWEVNLPEKPEGQTEEAAMLSDEYYIAAAAKRKGLGLIQFIGELYKLGMLTLRIMHECVVKLLNFEGLPDESAVESLVKLLRTVGGTMSATEQGQGLIKSYFERIQSIMEMPELPSRLHFMLLDTVDLRKKNWHSKDDQKGPKTLQEIHDETMAANQQKELERSRQNQRGGGGGGRAPMGRGDARNFSGNMPPPPDYTRNTVAMEDLRRLGRGTSHRNANSGGSSLAPSLGAPSMFGSRSGSGRKTLGPPGTGEASGNSSRTGTPPVKEKEKEPTTNANAFSALAALDPSGEGEGAEEVTSPPSAAGSPPTTKANPAAAQAQPKSPVGDAPAESKDDAKTDS